MEGEGTSAGEAGPGRAEIVLRWWVALLLAVSPFLFCCLPIVWPPRHGHGNDTAAMATLRNLSNVQAEFSASRAVDLDGDGVGEFGSFQELTASSGLRTDPAAGVRGGPLKPAMLSPSLASVDAQGTVTKAGYRFRILLPGGGGSAVGERSPGLPFTGAVDTDTAERAWLASAAPVAWDNSGTVALLVTEQGEVYQCANEDGRYEAAKTPDLRSLPAGWRWGFALPAVFNGRDGSEWRRRP